jgi:vacuolar iron transporter family protein
MPLLITNLSPPAGLIPLVSGASLVFLALLSELAARAGGAGVTVRAIRVTFWGAAVGEVWERNSFLRTSSKDT